MHRGMEERPNEGETEHTSGGMCTGHQVKGAAFLPSGWNGWRRFPDGGWSHRSVTAGVLVRGELGTDPSHEDKWLLAVA